MKIFLEKAIFVNRAPFERLELDFKENEIAVLSAMNGKGKTTILSHITDAFHEMARPTFPNEYSGKENHFYRVSTDIYNLNRNEPSFVYLRFKINGQIIDYLDVRGFPTIEQYENAISIDNKILFSEFKSQVSSNGFIKKIKSLDIDVKKIFNNNILTYFPSYRFEQPGYLNKIYEVEHSFTRNFEYDGYLPNPIEVVNSLSSITNWLLDIILDLRLTGYEKEKIQQVLNQSFVQDKLNNPELELSDNIVFINNLASALSSTLYYHIEDILSKIFSSKTNEKLSFGAGVRSLHGQRLQIVKSEGRATFYPNIHNLSSGESSLLVMFVEILRQSDRIFSLKNLNEIQGIVLIDEIDKHLHIKLQKEVLPELMSRFPNVQFIITSHSPFLGMGLAEELQERSKIIDLDNLGISTDPTTNELYKEVYEMMVGENDRFKEQYEKLKAKVNDGSSPLIVTEGKTDIQHIKKAKEKLNITDLDIDFYEITTDWGDSKLKLLLDQLSKVPQSRKIIGILDRDVSNIIDEIEKDDQSFKNYGNNVFAFCIPVPESREAYQNISIEFYYSDDELKKEDNGKCLYFDNEVEFRQSASNKGDRKLTKLETLKTEEESSKKIFDENIGDLDWIHSKARFAELVETDNEFISSFDFSNFNLIFNKVREIINYENN